MATFEQQSENIDEEQFKCDVCDAVVLNADELKLHFKSVHERKAGPLKCKICGETFAARQKLILHKESIHKLKR